MCGILPPDRALSRGSADEYMFGTRIMKHCLPTVILLVLAFSFGTPSQEPKSASPRNVALCDLLHHPSEYDNQIVRVRALWRQTFEWSQLYDTTCEGSVEPIWDCPGDDTCKNLQRYLTRHLKGDPMDGMYAQFTFVGRFKDMHKPKPRFGEYSLALYITGMTDAKPVASESPSPRQNRDKQKP